MVFQWSLQGYIHGLLGSNGIGKSTLLKIVCGLIEPLSGSVETLSHKPSERQPSLYRELFMIPEEFELPAISFRTYMNVYKQFYPNFSDADIGLYMSELYVDPQVRLDLISMGQKKRALIAFALACNTRLLIMDEPTNGLDIPAKSAFRRMIASYVDQDRTVVISTHQVRDVNNLIDNVVILDHEGIVLNCTTEQIETRLSFGPVQKETPGLIYSEEGLRGTCGVMENQTGQASKVDLDLLFNAVLQQRDKMSAVFSH